MTTPLRTAITVCRRGVVGSLVGSAAAIGVISGQYTLARLRIPRAATGVPPTDDTVWAAPGTDRRRRVLRVAVLGDSMAAGYGVEEPEQTLAGQLALRLSAATRRPVAVRNVAAVGARSRDLRAQLNSLDAARPDVAVIVVGANDVTHQSSRTEAVRHLVLAVHRLRAAGTEVVVGTCPDVGTVPWLAEPLRSVASRRARQLARAQTVAVLRAGGRTASLGELRLRFQREQGMFGPDRFHPSATGYAAAADLFAEAVGACGPVAAVA